MAHDVFISHSSNNKSVADEICSALEKNEIRCWIAPRDIPAGVQYGAEITKGICNCSAFLLVFSEEVNDSAPVQKELELALSYKKTIIPFRIDSAAMNDNFQYYLSNVQWIDADVRDENFSTLICAIKNIFEANSYVPSAPLFDAGTTPRPKLINILGKASLNISEGNYTPTENEDIVEKMIDRIGLLQTIDDKLQKGIPIYICANGGVGKTKLIRTYCLSDYAQKYNYVFWVNCNSLDIRMDMMKEPVFCFNQMIGETSDVDILFKQFILQNKITNKEVLLVVDGVEHEKQLDSIQVHLPQLNWCILVATRARKKELSFEQKTIELNELETNYCEDLFYSHYSDNNRENDTETLHALFEALGHNTYMISLFAKQGYDMDYSVCELAEMLKDTDTANDVYETFRNGTRKLFDASKLNPDEKVVLSYFTLMPSKPLPENILLNWFACDGLNIRQILRTLHKKGWLLYTKSPEGIYFQCHSLIIATLKTQSEIKQEDLERLLGNVADFLDMPKVEQREAYWISPYSDCIEALLEHCNENNETCIRLKKNYIQLCLSILYNPKRTSEFVTSLRDITKKAFDEKSNKTFEDKINYLEIELLYCDSLTDASMNINFNLVEKVSLNALAFAENFLDETDLLRLRAGRFAGIALRNNDHINESIEILERILAKTKDIGLNNDEICFRLNALQSLGVSYNRLVDKLDDIDKKKKYLYMALEIRKQMVSTSLLLWAEKGSGMRSAYNDLGMTYLYLTDFESNSQYFSEAQRLLLLSYELRLDHCGENSAAAALAMVNLAALYYRQEKYDDALQCANKALIIRKELYGNDSFKVMLALRLIGIIHLLKYIKNKSYNELLAASKYIDETLKIGFDLYSDENHTNIRKNIFLKKTLQKALNNEDISQSTRDIICI